MGHKGLRYLLRAAGVLALVPYLLTLLVVLTGAPTWSGIAYLLGMGMLVMALATMPVGWENEKRSRFHFRGMTRGATVFLFAVMGVRCCSAGAGNSLHFEPSARLVDRLVDERDIALSGTRVLVAGHMLQDDKDELPAKMREAYEQMADEQGNLPSPVAATYLGLQRPDAYDMAVIEPRRGPNENMIEPTEAIIFLHGFAGNFSLPCWQVSKAVEDLDVLTVCPSTRYVGDWSSKNGEATLRKTVDYLHGRGITKIVLSGLSNGGYGASLLAPKFRGTFVGVILISGAEDSAGSAGVPVLLIHGSKDSMAGYEDSTAYVANHASARLVTLNAGHFAMLVKSEQSNRAIHDFVARTTGKSSAAASRRVSSAGRSL